MRRLQSVWVAAVVAALCGGLKAESAKRLSEEKLGAFEKVWSRWPSADGAKRAQLARECGLELETCKYVEKLIKVVRDEQARLEEQTGDKKEGVADLIRESQKKSEAQDPTGTKRQQARKAQLIKLVRDGQKDSSPGGPLEQIKQMQWLQFRGRALAMGATEEELGPVPAGIDPKMREEAEKMGRLLEQADKQMIDALNKGLKDMGAGTTKPSTNDGGVGSLLDEDVNSDDLALVRKWGKRFGIKRPAEGGPTPDIERLKQDAAEKLRQQLGEKK